MTDNKSTLDLKYVSSMLDCSGILWLQMPYGNIYFQFSSRRATENRFVLDHALCAREDVVRFPQFQEFVQILL